MQILEFEFSNRKISKLPPPTVDAYYKIYFAVSEKEEVEGISDWLTSATEEARQYINTDDIIKAKKELSDWLRELRRNPAYKPPHAKDDTQEEIYYKTSFHELKIVSDYTGINFNELRKMDVLTFWRYYRDAIIHICNKSEDGKDYLRRAYNEEQTKPDRAAIAAIMNMQ